jgi:hypothetical protein
VRQFPGITMTTIKVTSLGGQADSGAVPAWHMATLSERLHRLDTGSEHVSPWPEARERIRAQTKAGVQGASNKRELSRV